MGQGLLLFQSTPPARGATPRRQNQYPLRYRFNPRPPHGGRQRPYAHKRRYKLFQSTPPARGATASFWAFSITNSVSIHAPRTGGDPNTTSLVSLCRCFNPRPPHGGRPFIRGFIMGKEKFQSTPPARGATTDYYVNIMTMQFQSTPPARGATYGKWAANPQKYVSIHAPRTGGDVNFTGVTAAQIKFQSTPPARGATW